MHFAKSVTSAIQWPSEATLASDREARLQSEIRSLAESETCANQQRVETEDEAREQAELRHEILEVDAEVREQHVQIQNVMSCVSVSLRPKFVK